MEKKRIPWLKIKLYIPPPQKKKNVVYTKYSQPLLGFVIYA